MTRQFPNGHGGARRFDSTLMTAAEAAIYEAIRKVEELGADERLSAAVSALSDAHGHLADWVDGRLTEAVEAGEQHT